MIIGLAALGNNIVQCVYPPLGVSRAELQNCRPVLCFNTEFTASYYFSSSLVLFTVCAKLPTVGSSIQVANFGVGRHIYVLVRVFAVNCGSYGC